MTSTLDNRVGTQTAAEVADAVRALAAGQVVVLLNRDTNSCELVAAAAQMSTELMAFTVRHTAGFVRVAMPQPEFQRLRIPPMWWDEGTVGRGARFMVAVDALSGVTTGISAHDRARTTRLLADGATRPEDFSRPGHVPTVMVHEPYELTEFGDDNGAVWMCRYAELPGAAALSELVDGTGELATVDGGRRFARRHKLSTVALDAVRMMSFRVELA